MNMTRIPLRWFPLEFPLRILSGRRACVLMSISISVWRYRARTDSSCQLRERIILLAGQRRRFASRRIHILPKREGWHISVGCLAYSPSRYFARRLTA
jgi:hypothetical protein